MLKFQNSLVLNPKRTSWKTVFREMRGIYVYTHEIISWGSEVVEDVLLVLTTETTKHPISALNAKSIGVKFT